MPPKEKKAKSKTDLAREATETFTKAFEPGEAAGMSLSAGLRRMKDATVGAPVPESAPSAPAAAPAVPATPVAASDELSPDAAEVLNAMLFGGPAAAEETVQRQRERDMAASSIGFGNVPQMLPLPEDMPRGIVYEAASRAGPAPEKRPVGRPRSNSGPTRPPPPAKVVATDEQMNETALLLRKIRAYMRIRPVIAESVMVPVPGSSVADYQLCLAQCRDALSWGMEERALQMAVGATATGVEMMLPYLQDALPEEYAAMVNGRGFARDVQQAMDPNNNEQGAPEFREALSLCAVDLYGLLFTSPWAMLGLAMFGMFSARVAANNQALRQQARDQVMQRGVNVSGVRTDDL